MAMTIEERKEKSREKRSSAVTSKINLLRTRDGSVSPPIESLKDFDAFNMAMLFGVSTNENIDWNNLGVEGLIRAYYYITQKLSGKTRNNYITDGFTGLTWPTLDSSIDQSAKWLFDGVGERSGFYKNDETDGRQGIFNPTSNTFNNNIKGAAPALDTNNLLNRIDAVLTEIGVEASQTANARGPFADVWVSEEEGGYWLTGEGAAQAHRDATKGSGVLGKRTENSEVYSSPIGGGGGDEGDNWYVGKDGIDTPNYYDATFHSIFNQITALIDEINIYIGYAKVSNFSYFANTGIIPFKSESPEYNTLDSWIATLNSIKPILSQYLIDYSPVNNTKINALKSSLTSYRAQVLDINNLSDSTTVHGDVGNPSTLRGARLLWVKTILDPSEGSRISVKSIDFAMTSVNNSIIQAEEEYGIFGINRVSVPWAASTAWNGGLPTSAIAGIETYATVDSDSESESFGEMIITGYILAWEGIDHATSYDVFKSNDWDGSSGTWTKIIPAGNSFTVEDIDLNSGKVLTYYIDTDVNIEEGDAPYYKVVGYDSGGSGDYSRIPSYSAECAPKNYEDFLAEGSSTPFVGPSGPPPAQPGSVPPYLFKWTTVKSGAESADNPFNRQFQSDASFDSVGSNLEVFLNGVIVNKGSLPNEYQVVSDKLISFNSQLDDSDKVTMIVYFGGAGSGSGAWKEPVASFSNLPNTGNSEGDIRLVLDVSKLYTWSVDSSSWTEIKGSTSLDINHNSLSDMPDSDGINADHDERYYTEPEVDDKLSAIQSQINALQFMVPDDAIPLGGALRTTGTNFKTGYLSLSNTNSFVTLAPLSSFSRITNTATFSVRCPSDDQFSDADKGVLKLFVNNVEVDSFDLGAAFDSSESNGPQSYTPAFGVNGILQIIDVSPHLGYGSHQKGNFTAQFNSSVIVPGENKIKVVHTISGNDRTTDDLILFYDSLATPNSVDSMFITQVSATSNKYLSGVRHYTINDSLRFRFMAYNLFDSTHVLPNQFYVDNSEFACSAYYDNYKSSYLTNVANGAVGNEIWYDRNSVLNVPNVYSSSPALKITANDPFNSNTFTKGSNKILINTYSNFATDKNEHFVDESYRLAYQDWNTAPSPYKSVWSSNLALGSNDLQVYNEQLIYPKINFSTGYLPAQSVNYSMYSGSRFYLRAFLDSGRPHNNGIFNIESYNISSENVKISMKLPTQTGWLDLSKLYNEADFTGATGDGCLIQSEGYNFVWTSGSFSTASSSYMVILRIEMKNSDADPINNISINW